MYRLIRVLFKSEAQRDFQRIPHSPVLFSSPLMILHATLHKCWQLGKAIANRGHQSLLPYRETGKSVKKQKENIVCGEIFNEPLATFYTLILNLFVYERSIVTVTRVLYSTVSRLKIHCYWAKSNKYCNWLL